MEFLLHHTSSSWQDDAEERVEIRSLDDLLALVAREGNPVIVSKPMVAGEPPSLEVYDDYRE